MKKITILLLLNILLGYFLNAQITVTNNDMPMVNDTIRLNETNDIQGIDPVLTGANYTWDYSTLVSTSQRIDTFFSVSSTPTIYQFFFNNVFLYPNHKASYALSGVDIGTAQVSISEVFNYIKNSPSAYENVGFGSNINGIPSSTQIDPVDREYTFPMNYNNNGISNSAYAITVPSFGYYGQKLERMDTVDGWGSLILPNGTHNVLRVKSILKRVDTTYLDLLSLGTIIPRPEEIEYKWLSAGKGMPILKVVTIAGLVTQIEYQDGFAVSIEEVNQINNVNLFPNPVKTHLIIDFRATLSGDLKINLKDLLGKDVGFIYNGKIISGNNKLVIDLTQYNFEAGVYLAEFVVEKQPYYSQKIIIVE